MTRITLTNHQKLNISCKKNLKSLILTGGFESNVKKKDFNLSNYWLFLYQQQYISLMLDNLVVFKSINSQQLIPQSLIAYIIYSVKSYNWKRYNIIHSNEVIELLFISLWLKNLTLFMGWMRKYFEKANLKKHRKLFLLLNFLLGRFIWNYNIFLNLKGLRIILLGKFGKAGSVRKIRKYIKKGKCSYTSKNISLINQTNIIRTITGVFSIKMEIFY